MVDQESTIQLAFVVTLAFGETMAVALYLAAEVLVQVATIRTGVLR